VWALPLWPQATPTSPGEELAEFGRHAFVPATGDQRNEDNDKLCQRELSAAGEVLGAFLGNRLNEVEEQGEQSLIKIDRGRRFFWVILLILVQLLVYECFDAICSHKAVS
jgi:hypothetical protein